MTQCLFFATNLVHITWSRRVPFISFTFPVTFNKYEGLSFFFVTLSVPLCSPLCQEADKNEQDDEYKSKVDRDSDNTSDEDHVVLESPEPSTSDPMTDSRPTVPVLYLSTAGKRPLIETRLMSFTEVKLCPDEYPTGWTIRCDVISKPPVIFRVMGQIYSKEYRVPYYLSGNWRDQVGDFVDEGAEFLAKSNRLRIACRVRTRKAVWVDIVVGC